MVNHRTALLFTFLGFFQNARLAWSVSTVTGFSVAARCKENHGLSNPYGSRVRVATGTGTGRNFPTREKPTPAGTGWRVGAGFFFFTFISSVASLSVLQLLLLAVAILLAPQPPSPPPFIISLTGLMALSLTMPHGPHGLLSHAAYCCLPPTPVPQDLSFPPFPSDSSSVVHAASFTMRLTSSSWQRLAATTGSLRSQVGITSKQHAAPIWSSPSALRLNHPQLAYATCSAAL